MRLLPSSLLLLASLAIATADIQDPPAKKYGATRKISRGLANMTYGFVELPSTMIRVNDSEGNGAAFSYGIVLGVQRSLERFGIGFFEVVTHPFPINKGDYRPYFESPTRGVNNAFEEFPPELGFNTSFEHVRPSP